MAFDLTTIAPSEFIEFRDSWIKEAGLSELGADILFENAGLSELVELDVSELKEYAKEIGLTVIQRKRLVKGILKLNGLSPSTNTPSTPNTGNNVSNAYANISTNKKPKKIRKKDKKSNKDKKEQKSKRKRSKSKSKTRTPKTPKSYEDSDYSNSRKNSSSKSNQSIDSDAPMYDPTGKTSVDESMDNTECNTYSTSKAKDLLSLISNAIEQLQNDGNMTKNDIRATFMDFRTRLTEREMKLLHDVDTTVDKKTRLLQTQLEYVKNDNNSQDSHVCCDPNMNLDIDKSHILQTLICAGWVKGASSDNKEEEEMQNRERKRRVLARQQYLTVERLKEITLFERDCGSKRIETVRLTNEVQTEIQKINDRTRECETELAAAKPLLESAQKLVSKISKSQLNEIRVLKKPPAVVELVMSAVTVMLGNKIKSWRDIQKILSNPKFIPSVLEFDTMALKRRTREECIKYVNHTDFNEGRANKASKVAGPLVTWVKSQVKYSELLDVVRPMQKEIKILKRKLDKKQKQLRMCIQVVNTLEMKISKSRTDISGMVDNMIKLQDTYNFGEDNVTELKSLALYKTISK